MNPKKQKPEETPMTVEAPEKKLTKAESKLEAALKAISEDLKVSLSTFRDQKIESVQRIPTGSLSLDMATGGGWARGRVHEVYGAEMSGKSLLALNGIAQAQRMGLSGAFIDVEQAFDPIWAAKQGVDLDNLIFIQPDSAEEALNVVDKLLERVKPGFIVVDSVSALVTETELEGKIGDHHVGTTARLMSQTLKILTPKVANASTALVFINQLRHKIGVMFGNPETTSGGMALKFYSSIRIDVRRLSKSEILDENKQQVGYSQRIKVVKNKTFPPYREAEVPISYVNGIRAAEDFVKGVMSVGLLDQLTEVLGTKDFNEMYTKILAGHDGLEGVRKQALVKAGVTV